MFAQDIGVWVTENLSVDEIRRARAFLESPAGRKFVGNRYAEATRSANELGRGNVVEMPQTRPVTLSPQEASAVKQFEQSPEGKKLIDGGREDRKLEKAFNATLDEIARRCRE